MTWLNRNRGGNVAVLAEAPARQDVMIVDVDTVLTTALAVDSSYQRPLDERRVDAMVKDWKPRIAGLLEVSARADGRLIVFDGQHRLEAHKRLEHREISCLVHRGLNAAGEAQLFADLQIQRKNLKPLDRFKAQLVAGNEESLAIQAILRDHGFEIGKPETPLTSHHIGAVTGLERAYRRSPQALAQALSLIKELWYREPKSTDGNFVTGLARFCEGYGHRIDDITKEKFREFSPVTIVRRALARSTTFIGNKQEALFVSEFRHIAQFSGKPKKTA